MHADFISQVSSYLQHLQADICAALEALEPTARFLKDSWTRVEGGGGVSAVLEKGLVFEKAGVNFSHVSGATLPAAATQQRPDLCDRHFHALGVSLVIHPDNPFVPTTHANVRFFIAEKPNEAPVWWFGGGFDLTPYYGFVEDCVHWHQTAKAACDPFDPDYYSTFKDGCDRYFFLPHRNEARGIGGLFFDDFHEQDFDYSFSFMQSIGNHFLKAYLPIVQRRQHTPFNATHKDFQLYRRGRYVEFNLLYDRGTRFGIESNGRAESILISLPPVVHWQYNYHPAANTREATLYTDYLPVKNWLD